MILATLDQEQLEQMDQRMLNAYFKKINIKEISLNSKTAYL